MKEEFTALKMEYRMTYASDSVVAMVASSGAFIFSQIASQIDNEVMAYVSGVSAIVLCLTAVIKMVDLVIEMFKKYRRKRPNNEKPVI